jgi:hypothetical protein
MAPSQKNTPGNVNRTLLHSGRLTFDTVANRARLLVDKKQKEVDSLKIRLVKAEQSASSGRTRNGTKSILFHSWFDGCRD